MTPCPRCRRPESPDGCQRAAKPDDMWAELDCAMESIARLEREAAKLAEVSRPCGRARPLPEGVRGLFTPPFKVDPSDPERLVDSLGNIAAGRMFYNAHFDAWGRERFRHLPYGNELYDAWCEWFDMDAEDGAEVARRLNEAWRVTP